MISEKDLYSLLSSKLPGMEPDFKYLGNTGCPYKLAAFFSSYAKKQMQDGDEAEIKKCFTMAELLIAKGDLTVVNAMANVFVFSVSYAPGAANYFKKEYPLLTKEYRRQQNATVMHHH